MLKLALLTVAFISFSARASTSPQAECEPRLTLHHTLTPNTPAGEVYKEIARKTRMREHEVIGFTQNLMGFESLEDTENFAAQLVKSKPLYSVVTELFYTLRIYGISVQGGGSDLDPFISFLNFVGRSADKIRTFARGAHLTQELGLLKLNGQTGDLISQSINDSLRIMNNAVMSQLSLGLTLKRQFETDWNHFSDIPALLHADLAYLESIESPGAAVQTMIQEYRFISGLADRQFKSARALGNLFATTKSLYTPAEASERQRVHLAIRSAEYEAIQRQAAQAKEIYTQELDAAAKAP